MSTSQLIPNPNLMKVAAYVRGKSTEELKRMLGLEHVIKLGSNENPLGPSPKAMQAVELAASAMHQYPSVEVYDLRYKLAEFLGSGLEAENVIVGNGSADVILSLAQTYLHAGGEVIISPPAFQMYELVTTMHGGQCIFVEGNGYAYDLQAVADRITPLTRMIFVTNPNNPTGLIVNHEQVDTFMDRVPPSVLVVFDEAYHEYVETDEYPDTRRYIKDGRNVIMTRTFSKVYGLAGMRIGYGVARREIISALLRTQPAFHCGGIALAAAMASLEDRDHFKRSQEVNAKGKKFLYRSFEELGLQYLPSQANFVMLINLPYDVEAINQAMLRQGVIIRPTAPFGLPQAIRVTVGTQEENDRVIAAFGHAFEDLARTQ